MVFLKASLLLCGVMVLAPGFVQGQPSDLFISEYIEGSSNNKAIEVFNGTGAAIDLEAATYQLAFYFNGNTAPSTTIPLTGNLGDGMVYVVADDEADPSILAVADLVSNSTFFNGDDAVVLFKGSTVVDVIGQVGFDPGSEWGSGSISTANNTLRRRPDACTGDTDETDDFTPNLDPSTGAWNGFSQDTFDNLGAHSITCGLPPPPPPTDPVINEFIADHTGSDSDEFIEIVGDPDTDYAAFTILEIEGDAGSPTGRIDDAFTLGTTDSDGFWWTGFLGSAIENGTITLLLVHQFNGSIGDDIDVADDGTIDTTPWARLVDAVALHDDGAGDFAYTTVALHPGFDGVSGAPGGASRIPNGIDTDTVADWLRNDFDGEGLPGVPGGTPEDGEAVNTPGAINVEGQTPPPPPAPEGLLINEVDTDTPGPDDREFIELYDGGAGHTPLDGLVVVLFNGDDDASYRAIDLDGYTTDASGYFVLGSAALTPPPDLILPNSALQNGPDAVALFRGDAGHFPNDTPVTDAFLIDALVYGTSDPIDYGLLALLHPGEPQIDEDALDGKDYHSSQRMPNGSGGRRNTSTYAPLKPTPGDENGGADLCLSNTLTAQSMQHGTVSARFTLTLTNDGPADATGIVVMDGLPDEITIDSASPSQGTYDPATGAWVLGTLAEDNAAVLDLLVTAPADQPFIIRAEVTAADQADPDSDPGDGQGDDATLALLNRAYPAPPDFQADVSLTMTTETSTLSAGDSLHLVLTVTNDGPDATAGIEVTVQLPDALAFAKAEGAGSYDPSDGLWVPDVLGLNKSATLALTLIAEAAGDGTITAEITGHHLPDPDSAIGNHDPEEDDQTSISVTVEAAPHANFALPETTTLALEANYPNPFNPTTIVPVTLPDASHVSLIVYDLLGRVVEVLVDGLLEAGRHEIRWHAARYPSGTYLIRLHAASTTHVRHVTLLR